jgi:hypothetical protein
LRLSAAQPKYLYSDLAVRLAQTGEQGGGMVPNPQPFIKQKNANIPLLFRRLYPRIKLKEFEELMQSETFLKKKVLVCHLCFLDITDTIKEAGVPVPIGDPIDDAGMYDQTRNINFMDSLAVNYW